MKRVTPDKQPDKEQEALECYMALIRVGYTQAVLELREWVEADTGYDTVFPELIDTTALMDKLKEMENPENKKKMNIELLKDEFKDIGL